MYRPMRPNKPRRVIHSIDELPVICDCAEAGLLLRQNPAGAGLQFSLYQCVSCRALTAVRLSVWKTPKNPICFFPCPPVPSAILGSSFFP